MRDSILAHRRFSLETLVDRQRACDLRTSVNEHLGATIDRSLSRLVMQQARRGAPTAPSPVAFNHQPNRPIRQINRR